MLAIISIKLYIFLYIVSITPALLSVANSNIISPCNVYMVLKLLEIKILNLSLSFIVGTQIPCS